MKIPSLAFLVAIAFLTCLIGQFVPLLLTIGMSVAFMGFPIPYATERRTDYLGMGDGPYSSTSFSAIPAMMDVAFVVFIICFLCFRYWERQFGRQFTFFKDFSGVSALAIIGMSIVYYLWQDQLWQEVSHGNDPCYAYVDGKAPTYLIKNGLICVLRDERGHTSYYGALEGADAKTFVDFNDGCGKDAQHVYCGSEIQSFLDAGKFHELKNGYATDDRFLVYYGRLVPDADPASFLVLPGNYFAKDARRVYRNGVAFEGADAASFSIISDDAELSKDKNHVYYANRVIQDADPATFIHIGKRFARDKHQVYCNGEPLPDLDVNTYLPVDTSDYLRDDNSLYYCAKKVEGVDPAKFTIRSASKETESGMFSVSTDTCGTDGAVVVCHGEVQDGADPETYFKMNESEKHMLDVFDHSN